MDNLLLFLTLLPIVAAPLLILASREMFAPIVSAFVLLIITFSLSLFTSYESEIVLNLPNYAHLTLTIIDFAVLGLFLYVGFKRKNPKIWILALVQSIMFVTLIFAIKPSASIDLKLDYLSLMLIMLVSIVGGIITIYSTTYMKYDDGDHKKRHQFTAILVAFLGVMNLLAVSENLEIFFLAFELTTLASFVLIGWRGDEQATKNSELALWMNQIGGIAILTAMIYLGSNSLDITFASLVDNPIMLPIAFLAVAALVKGAQMPFDKWLLGAMVAPTPVSAILHSSTMVKIAPFMILKLSPAIAGTYLGSAIVVFGGFVFVLAGVMALGKQVFKEILAYSTISLLGLMIMLAAIGTSLSITAAVTLMIFHGVAKAMLFMEAGVMEKLYHTKSVNEMCCMYAKAPMSVVIVLLGFASVTLPPFGALVGKWAALEAASITSSFSFVFIALGSVVITLLYFKVVGFMVAKSGENIGVKIEDRPLGFKWTNYTLAIMLAISAVLIAPLVVNLFAPVAELLVGETDLKLIGLGLSMPAGSLPFWQILSLFIIILLVPLAGIKHIKGVDRVTEYSGGERLPMRSVGYYFEPSKKSLDLIMYIGIAFFVAIVLLGVML